MALPGLKQFVGTTTAFIRFTDIRLRFALSAWDFELMRYRVGIGISAPDSKQSYARLGMSTRLPRGISANWS